MVLEPCEAFLKLSGTFPHVPGPLGCMRGGPRLTVLPEDMDCHGLPGAFTLPALPQTKEMAFSRAVCGARQKTHEGVLFR